MAKSKKKTQIQPKSKEMMREISDIVKNSETDEAALEFLKDTLEDDFPDLELGSMNLHEATKVLGGSELEETDEKGNKKMIESLNESLGKFIEKQEVNHAKRKRKRKRKRK